MRYAFVVALVALGCEDPTAPISRFPDCAPGQFPALWDDPTTNPPTHLTMCLDSAAVIRTLGPL